MPDPVQLPVHWLSTFTHFAVAPWPAHWLSDVQTQAVFTALHFLLASEQTPAGGEIAPVTTPSQPPLPFVQENFRFVQV